MYFLSFYSILIFFVEEEYNLDKILLCFDKIKKSIQSLKFRIFN